MKKFKKKKKLIAVLSIIFLLIVAFFILFPSFSASYLLNQAFDYGEIEVDNSKVSAPEVDEKIKGFINDLKVTPNSLLNKRLQKNKIKTVSRFVVSCKKSRMDIYGIDDRSKEYFLGGIAIKTGRRALKYDDAVKYKLLNTKGQAGVFGDWVVYHDGANLSRAPKSAIQKCLPENIKNSNTTPLGSFTIVDKSYYPGGKISSNNGSNMGPWIFVYDNYRKLYIHGMASKFGFPPTLGCVRVKNTFLASLYPFVQPNKTKMTIVK